LFCPQLFVCLQPRGALENALKGHASSIRAIHKEQVVPLEQAMVKKTRKLMTVKNLYYTYVAANTYKSSPTFPSANNIRNSTA